MANCIATCDPPYHIIPQSVPLGHNLQTLLYVIFIIFMHNLPQLCLNGWSANLRPEEKHYLLRICNVVQKVMWFWSLFFNLIGKLKMIVHKYWSNAPLRNMTLSGGKFNWYLSWWDLKHTSTLVQRWQNSFTFKTKLPPWFKDGRTVSLLNKVASNNLHWYLGVGAHGS